MNLTRKQQFYLVVLGVGVIALALDRTVFSPASASGQETLPVISVATVDPTSATSSVTAVSASALPAAWRTRSEVADRLKAVSSSRDFSPAALRDAFHPSASWWGGFNKDFSDQYTLLAVMTGGTTDYALIGSRDDKGKPVRRSVRVKDVISGFTLEVIEPRSVTFRREDLKVVLTLIGPGGSDSDDPAN